MAQMSADQFAMLVKAVKAAMAVEEKVGEVSGGVLVEVASGVEAVAVEVVNPPESSGASEAGTSDSWADQVMEAEQLSVGAKKELREGECAACVWGVGECVCIRVEPTVRKRSYAEAVEVNVPDAVVAGTKVENAGFFRDYVDTDRARELRRDLQVVAKCKLPRDARVELALLLYTPGTVPDVFRDGPRRIQGLALVGDAAMTLVLASILYARGMSAESVQSARTRLLSNVKMQKSFSVCKLARHVTVPRGVTLVGSKTGADCCEAMAGLLYNWAGMTAVRAYMAALGLLPPA